MQNSSAAAATSAVAAAKGRVERSIFWYRLAFVFLSFGYMLPWTSLGSLISYYKYEYSANFYVFIYCAYYLPGLPVALLQYKYADYLDYLYGAKVMVLWKGIACYAIMAIACVSLTVLTSELALILMFTVLGISSWLMHGCASMFASLFPHKVIAFLQIGFRTPELYVIIMTQIIDLGKEANEHSLRIFYQLDTVMLICAMVLWIQVVDSQLAADLLDAKDYGNQAETPNERKGLLTGHSQQHQHQQQKQQKQQQKTKRDKAVFFSSSSNSSSFSSASSSFDDRIERSFEEEIEQNVLRDIGGDDDHEDVAVSDAPRNLRHELSVALGSLVGSSYGGFSSSDKGGGGILGADTTRDNEMLPLCLALVITMWGSIFQASFYAYVDPNTFENIEQILYLTRLVCDLFGRPMALLPRPASLQTNRQLLVASLWRSTILVLFFSYVIVPSFPQNDYFIIFLVGVFSVGSGYLTVLIYEHGARDDIVIIDDESQEAIRDPSLPTNWVDGRAETFMGSNGRVRRVVRRPKSKGQIAHNTNLLNLSFQLAAFMSVLLSAGISVFTLLYR